MLAVCLREQHSQTMCTPVPQCKDQHACGPNSSVLCCSKGMYLKRMGNIRGASQWTILLNI